jgi:spore coat protein U-like protein
VKKVLKSARIKYAVVLVAFASLAAPASAATVSSSLSVSANVTANCTISTSALNFGSVDTLSASPVDGTGGITVTCTNGTAWTAAADIGSGSGASFAARRMSQGANTLNYSLYTTAARTTVWGDGTGTTATFGNTGNGAAQNVTVYGRIPGSQTSAPAGGYADTVSVTVTY